MGAGKQTKLLHSMNQMAELMEDTAFLQVKMMRLFRSVNSSLIDALEEQSVLNTDLPINPVALPVQLEKETSSSIQTSKPERKNKHTDSSSAEVISVPEPSQDSLERENETTSKQSAKLHTTKPTPAAKSKKGKEILGTKDISVLTRKQRLVFDFLYKRRSWCFIDQLVEATGIKNTSLYAHLARLEELELVEKKSFDGNKNQYRPTAACYSDASKKNPGQCEKCQKTTNWRSVHNYCQPCEIEYAKEKRIPTGGYQN